MNGRLLFIPQQNRGRFPTQTPEANVPHPCTSPVETSNVSTVIAMAMLNVRANRERQVDTEKITTRGANWGLADPLPLISTLPVPERKIGQSVPENFGLSKKNAFLATKMCNANEREANGHDRNEQQEVSHAPTRPQNCVHLVHAVGMAA